MHLITFAVTKRRQFYQQLLKSFLLYIWRTALHLPYSLVWLLYSLPTVFSRKIL